MVIIVICLSMEKKFIKLSQYANVNFPSQFCLGSIPDKFSYTEAEEKEMCMIFQLIMGTLQPMIC